jgi:hypothetical protein
LTRPGIRRRLHRDTGVRVGDGHTMASAADLSELAGQNNDTIMRVVFVVIGSMLIGAGAGQL